jgi:hypothetical protein
MRIGFDQLEGLTMHGIAKVFRRATVATGHRYAAVQAWADEMAVQPTGTTSLRCAIAWLHAPSARIGAKQRLHRINVRRGQFCTVDEAKLADTLAAIADAIIATRIVSSPGAWASSRCPSQKGLTLLR